jgi:hypothetical protein
MIITDVKQIDRIAEEAFGKTKGIISVDMTDYTFIKEHSSSLKAIKIEMSEISEESFVELDKALEEVCGYKDCNILLYISGNSLDSETNAITMDQLQLFAKSIEKYVTENSNIIWGIGENTKVNNEITTLIIVGYDEK